MRDEEETLEEDDSPHVPQTELLWSYLAFGARALKRRRLLSLLVFLGVAAVTVAAVVLWPRTYHCEMKLTAQRNEVLAPRNGGGTDALRGAAEAITRHENLQAIVKQTDLVRNWELRRPPILKLKDAVLGLFRGPTSEADKAAMLVATLETRLSITPADPALSIGVDWPDAQMAARLVETAEQNFLETRHVAEVSTVAEYISILEGHAAKLREEIDTLADQMTKMREERVNQAGANAQADAPPAGADTKGPAAPGARRTQTRTRLGGEEDLPRLKVMLETKQAAIRQFEDDRKRRVADLQAKLNEVKSRFTPAHPAVVDLEQQLATMSAETPQVTMLKAEVDQLEGEIKQRTNAYIEGAPRPDGATMGAAGANPAAGPGGAPQAGLLPTELMQLLHFTPEGLDPAVGAQFRYAVSKYSTVRDQISTARIDLDTAQAAFKYRYKVVTPAEVPTKPIKPKVPVILGGGLFLALLLALLAPVALELRRGKIVEQWQVAQLDLPVLAELRFPPGPSD